MQRLTAKTVVDLKAAKHLASLLNAQENYRLAQQLLEEAKVAAQALAQRDAALETNKRRQILKLLYQNIRA